MLNVYELEERVFENFLVRKFDSPSEEWLVFFAANKKGAYTGVRYDLIMGPVANDNVYATIGLYMQGFMSREATINELRVRKLYDQLVFASPRTFNYLTHVRTEVL